MEEGKRFLNTIDADNVFFLYLIKFKLLLQDKPLSNLKNIPLSIVSVTARWNIYSPTDIAN
jgi:hypothetical protein